MTGGRPWTEFDDDRLRELAEAKTPMDRIKSILGRSDNAILNRCYALRIGLRGDLKHKPKVAPLDGIFLNGEPLQFAIVDRPCARCAVRETAHHQHGCGQFAAEVRVRIR